MGVSHIVVKKGVYSGGSHIVIKKGVSYSGRDK